MNAERSGLINFIAFIAIISIAILEVLSVLEHFHVITVGGTLINILNTIKNVAIIFVMGVSAYRYASNRKKTVRIIFLVAILIIIATTVLLWI